MAFASLQPLTQLLTVVLSGFDSQYRLLLSDQLKSHLPNKEIQQVFITRELAPLRLPDKNLPDPDLLQWHLSNIYQHD